MKINNREVSEEKIRLLVNAVKAKKEFAGIEDRFVESELVGFLRQSRKLLEVVSSRGIEMLPRAKEAKKLVKITRAILRRTHGVFQLKEVSERRKILEELRKNPDDLDLHKKMLATHLSSAERLQDYPIIYGRIFAVTGMPAVILDLGCGLNPFSFPWMGLDAGKVEYFASDLNRTDCELVQEYFAIKGIRGRAVQLNLLELRKNKKLLEIFPQADVCFLFKILETLELTKSHKISEELILLVPAKWVVASFATKTTGGGRMRNPRRGWIERMLERLSLTFQTFETESEIFYIIRKF